jgi:toxin ParE1/3/4
MQFRFSRRAEADLEEIAAYIARDNPPRAVSFIRELRQHCQHLLTFPEAAPLRPELGVGVRLSVFGNYLTLYVVHPDFLEIRRVVHGARYLADID